MFDDADKFLKIAVGLGVLAAGGGVGYHYVVRTEQAEQINPPEVKRAVEIKKEQSDPDYKLDQNRNAVDGHETIEISNITIGIDASGTSILLNKMSGSNYSGTILICEGGCNKFYLKGSRKRNFLNIRFGDHQEKIDLSELYSDGRAFSDENGRVPEGILFNCQNAKKRPDGDRKIASTFCLDHKEYKMEEFY